MHTFDSPMSSSHHHPQHKLKNHESPISKLTNLTDLKQSYQNASKNDNALNDKSNQVFVPKNAAKYVEEPFERKINREREIDEIRKKYFDNSSQKMASRPVSLKYDRYEMLRENEPRSSKRDQNGRDYNNDSVKRSVLINNRHDEHMAPSRYGGSVSHSNNSHIPQPKPTTQPYMPSSSNPHPKPQQKPTRPNFQMTFQPNQLNPTTNLDRISQASNSNYQTITKTLQTLSPQRHRVKSSFVVQDRSTKRKLTDANGYYYVDSFRNKENQSTVVKETTSVYNESATRVSHVVSHYDRDSAKSGKIDSRNQRNQPAYLKPFTLEDNPHKPSPKDTPLRQTSTQAASPYPTIYDNFLPKTSTQSTQQKLIKRQDEIQSRPRTYTQDKKYPIDRVQQKPRIYDPQDNAKRRVLKFQDDDKIKEIQKRLKDRQIEFKKRQQQLRSKCENNQFDRRTQYSQAKQSTTNLRNPQTNNQRANDHLQGAKNSYQQEMPSQSRPNVQKQIQRLSMKIRQFQDRKKELNIPLKTDIPVKNVEHQVVAKPKISQSQNQAPNSRQYEDARKALQEFRHGGKVKSTSQVYQVSEYQIPSANNEQSNCTLKHQQEMGFHKRHLKQAPFPTSTTNKRCQFIQNTKPMYSQRTLPTPKRAQQSSSFGFQLFKIQSQGDQASSNASKVTINSTTSNKTNSMECKSHFQIHRRTDDGIQLRKKKLQENLKTASTQQMKRLVSLLSQQTIHDEDFRNCKIWFQNERNQNKWKQLRRELIDCKEVRDQFTDLKDGTIAEFHICQDENNPFFSVNQQSKFSYQTLVKAYIAAKTFWQENILHKFNKNQLKAEGFTLEKFDLEKKGHINMEDLVRFLNFESGNFYRNRDLVLIFKRLSNEASEQKSEKALDIEKILKAIAN